MYMKDTTEEWGWKLLERKKVSLVIFPATIALVEITTERLKFAKWIWRVILNWHQQTETEMSQSKFNLPFQNVQEFLLWNTRSLSWVQHSTACGHADSYLLRSDAVWMGEWFVMFYGVVAFIIVGWVHIRMKALQSLGCQEPLTQWHIVISQKASVVTVL